MAQSKLQILTDATVTGAGAWYKCQYINDKYETAFQAIVTGTGAVSAAIDIEVSLDGVNACDTAAMTLTCPSATTVSSEGSFNSIPWLYVRANVTAISGTDASVDVFLNAALMFN